MHEVHDGVDDSRLAWVFDSGVEHVVDGSVGMHRDAVGIELSEEVVEVGLSGFAVVAEPAHVVPLNFWSWWGFPLSSLSEAGTPDTIARVFVLGDVAALGGQVRVGCGR